VSEAHDQKELATILSKQKINPLAYSLDGGLPSEKYVLDHQSDKWLVYYSERGLRSVLRTFDNEDAACRHFLTLLSDDAIANELSGWTISTDEVSAGVYAVSATDTNGRKIELTGTDPAKLMEEVGQHRGKQTNQCHG
jgi:hypothetical protein